MDTGKIIDILEARRNEMKISMRKLSREAGVSHATYTSMVSTRSDMSVSNLLAYLKAMDLELEVRAK